MVSRRNFLQSSAAMSALAALPLSVRWSVAQAEGLIAGLSDPALQPKFVNLVPDAMAPGFKYTADKLGRYKVQIREAMHSTGLIDPAGNPVQTPIWGYADSNAKGPKVTTWPGKTFEVMSQRSGGQPTTEVRWQNQLTSNSHLLPVDTNAHWCYSLPGYENFSIATDGVPMSTHLHGGHSDYQFDGNPEFFGSPKGAVVGPQWANVPGGFTEKFTYDNNVRAGNLWYHDHALGITRLNVYAGLAGFYFVRDEYDTGLPGNDLGLPAWPYEKAYAIQDRMFHDDGRLFYPAFPGDPAYADFITGEGAILDPLLFPDPGTNGAIDPATGLPFTYGGPTALAEFFGDHMVVNGLIWPKEDVEPRNYRFRLLNGTDSRFMIVRFKAVAMGADNLDGAGDPIPFQVIGSDQGLASAATEMSMLVFEPGARYDVVFDFSDPALAGKRIIMENIGGDAPFGGAFGADLADEDFFPDRQTDKIMAFDVVTPLSADPDDFNPSAIATFSSYAGVPVGPAPTITRKVALFEGLDEFGRLQPLLGAWDEIAGTFRAIPWHEPTTENPGLHTTEEWEIYNFTGDAHPVHLHLVHFEILGRDTLSFVEGAEPQTVTQHNGETGEAPSITSYIVGGPAGPEDPPIPDGAVDGYAENAPKDMVTALPAQVTRIRAHFDKPGRYVWHCHILSHEDHEMMRVLHVGPGA